MPNGPYCFSSAAFFDDPHRFYHQLRAERPVAWIDELESWVLTRHGDVGACLRDTRFSSAGRVAKVLDRAIEVDARPRLRYLYEHFSAGLIHSDPPAHTRIRSVINKAFTPRTVATMRPRLQTMVDELLGRVQSRGRIDVIADFAFPLPVAVIGEMLGVPITDRAAFKTWCDTVNGVLAATHTLEGALAIQESVLALRSFLAELIADRRRRPTDDLLSRLVVAQARDQRLSELELAQTAVTLLIAAHETTTNLIGNGVLALLRNDVERRRLQANPALLGTAVEEFLRYDSPLNHVTRIATEDLVVGGERIRRGDLVTVSLLAANRDPAAFQEPDRLDLARADNRHLAFGYGPHFCLGAGLARLEGSIAIGTLIARFPGLAIDSEQIEWRHDRVLRAAKAIPAVF